MSLKRLGQAHQALNFRIANAHARQLPVLFVTGACPADARSLAVGCLAKPFAPRDLLAAIAVVDAVLAGRAPPRKPRGMKLFAEIA